MDGVYYCGYFVIDDEIRPKIELLEMPTIILIAFTFIVAVDLDDAVYQVLELVGAFGV